MALASAAAFEGRSAAWSVSAVVVDHGLQPESRHVSELVSQRLSDMCLEAEVLTVSVGPSGGPEGAARAARYGALTAHADHRNAVVLLGHTRDDQAETVLLGLARGSGIRSLAGMSAVRHPFRRPLLDVTRAQTQQACLAEGLGVWDDPHNSDPAYARVRVRREVLPVLERELGPGIAAALARTARLARQDADALDTLAAELYRCAVISPALASPHRAEPVVPQSLRARFLPNHGLPGELQHLRIKVLAEAPSALRQRALRQAAREAGALTGELSAAHVESLDGLIADWHGQAYVELPGHLRATRTGEILSIRHTS